MIVEHRTYDIVPGKVATYLELYRAKGFEVQRSHLGCLLGYYSSELGVLNRIVHLWAYEDLNDRAKRRAALFADPAWLVYFEEIIPLVLHQEAVILTPAPFTRPMEAACGNASQ